KPSLTILGAKAENGGRIVTSDIFGGAYFNNVTIGGNVTNISGRAFFDEYDNSKYKGITGTLTILPRTVGYSKSSQSYYTNSMTEGVLNSGKHYGSFFDTYFDKVRLPKALYNEFIGKQWQVFGKYNGQPKNPSLGFTYEVISE
ncbi:MAG: hypothetical protein ILP22_10265, partial [Oscillospiraceae bacterium]|nr:hypothetical protein [Oscillospiraceae bacterium]